MDADESRRGGADGPTSAAPARTARRQRGLTIYTKRLPRREVDAGRALYPAAEHADAERPKHRGDCIEGVRPCPFVSCRHHLYLDVGARSGNIKLNFPHLEPDELRDSCALDVAERGEHSFEAIGATLNLTRERTRQIEAIALAKVEALVQLRELRDLKP